MFYSLTFHSPRPVEAKFKFHPKHFNSLFMNFLSLFESSIQHLDLFAISFQAAYFSFFTRFVAETNKMRHVSRGMSCVQHLRTLKPVKGDVWLDAIYVPGRLHWQQMHWLNRISTTCTCSTTISNLSLLFHILIESDNKVLQPLLVAKGQRLLRLWELRLFWVFPAHHHSNRRAGIVRRSNGEVDLVEILIKRSSGRIVISV